jgi:hypothetical protein
MVNFWYLLVFLTCFLMLSLNFSTVRPESPKIVQCQEVGHQLNVSIEPAASWSKPHSYFKLEHEIEYVSRHNGKVNSHTQNIRTTTHTH